LAPEKELIWRSRSKQIVTFLPFRLIMLAVSCKNIQKAYVTGTTRVDALRGVDLEVQTGELLLIVGPSGCGKTTLLSIIAGILTQDVGECFIFGENLNAMPNGEKTAHRGKNIGFVFQSFNLVPMLSLSENVAIPLILNGASEKEAERKAEEVLTTLGLEEKVRVFPTELSGGQQQRVAIARALIHEPRLLICDEPTAYLDHETGQKVMEVLKKIALNEERAIIVVTHDPRIFSFADHIVKMDDGRII
jgi:putative ABC transport system ATP-binding protein